MTVIDKRGVRDHRSGLSTKKIAVRKVPGWLSSKWMEIWI